MNKAQKIVASAALGLGLIGGAAGVAYATTQTGAVASASATQAGDPAGGGQAAPGSQTSAGTQAPADGQGGPGQGGQSGPGGDMAAQIATALNTDTATVQEVLDQVMSEQQASGTRPDRTTMDNTLAAALSAKLGVSESDVLAALQEAAPADGGQPPADGQGQAAGGQTNG